MTHWRNCLFPVIILICIASVVPVSACFHVFHPDPPSSIVWERNTSGNGDEVGYDIHETHDGGYIIAGTIGNPDRKSTAILIRKLDVSHNVIWERLIGNSGWSEGRKIRETGDGGFLFVGMAISNDGEGEYLNNESWDIVAGKLDPSGTIEWVKKFGGSNDDLGENIRLTDNGVIIIGRTFSSDGDVSARVNYSIKTKTDVTTGPEIQFNRSLPEFSQNGTDLDRLAYFTDDTIREKPDGQSDVWVIEIDLKGNILWQQRYGGSKDDYGYDIFPLKNGTVMFAGFTFSNDGDIDGNNFGGDTDTSDGWLVFLKPDHTIDWQKCIGGSKNDGFFSLEPANYTTVDSGDCAYDTPPVSFKQDGYVLAGFTESKDGGVFPRPNENHESYDGWIVRLNPDFSKKWTKCIGGSEFDVITSAEQTNKGKYIFSGSTFSTDGDVSRAGTDNNPPVPMIGLYYRYDYTIDWIKFPGNNESGILNSVEIAPDGAYITTGWIRSRTDTSRNLYAIRLSSPLSITQNLTYLPTQIEETTVTSVITMENSSSGMGNARISAVPAHTTAAPVHFFMPVTAICCIIVYLIRIKNKSR